MRVSGYTGNVAFPSWVGNGLTVGVWRDPVVRLSRTVLKTFQPCHFYTQAYGAHAVIVRRAATARQPWLLPASGYPRQCGCER